MSIRLSRSPINFNYPQLTTSLSLKLDITINGTVAYSLVKNFRNGTVFFEYGELVRDYIDIKYDDPNTWTAKVALRYTTYDGLNATGNVVEDITTQSNFHSDGYGYFEEGSSGAFSNDKGYLQTNDIIYKLDDSNLRIPIDRNVVSKVIYLNEGSTVFEETITSSTDYRMQYVGSGVDSFKERVLNDLGTYEDTTCINLFLAEFEINRIDRIILELDNGGTELIEVKNIEECKYEPVKVSFVNRYGAIQDAWFFKKSIETLTVKTEEFNRFDLNDLGQYDTTEHQRKTFNIDSNKSIKLNSGYVDESYNSIMQELFQSEYVWMKINQTVIPVNVKDSNLTFKTSVNDKLVDYSLNLEYSFSVINNVR